jgi:hypothetical protein
VQNQSREFVLTNDLPPLETTLDSNRQSPPDYNNFPPNLDGVKEPSTFGRAWFYSIRTTYHFHLLPIGGYEDVRCIYQRGRLEVYSLGSAPEMLGLINIGYLEANMLLQHVQVRHILTWIPLTNSHRTIIAKLVHTVIPELFGKTLLKPTYIVLSEDKYIENKEYHDCVCGCNH